ncbi:MAG: hypothetical protein R3250_04250, partial [Melioribacteraceae bacterium]|nr:hypothetical protein [Melioribacteraceae bacterium]
GGFSSGVKDINNLSDWRIDGIKFKSILKVPTVVNKLNDAVSGISLNSIFKYSIDNKDGFFDDTEVRNYANTFTVLKKATINNPTLDDFKIIRRGVVESTKISFDDFTVKAADYTRYLTNEVCNFFTLEDYPNAPNSTLNKKIPIGYNTLYNVQLFEVDRDQNDPVEWIDYVAIEPNWVDSVTKVYDSNGNELSFTVTDGIIRVPWTEVEPTVFEMIEAVGSDLEGKQNYSIGDIVTELINDNSFFKYIDVNWDLTETNSYRTNSADIGFYFSGGQLKTAVDAALKNDVAFLIVKNNGLLTIRQWAEDYTTHTLKSWTITQKPIKDFEFSSKYYISISSVKYNKDQQRNNFSGVYNNESQRLNIFDTFRKDRIGEYETEILTESDAEDFSDLLLTRFGGLKEELTVSIGEDTSEINLLDKVTLEVTINGRKFSNFTNWIVKEVNPAQDTLVLEQE